MRRRALPPLVQRALSEADQGVLGWEYALSPEEATDLFVQVRFRREDIALVAGYARPGAKKGVQSRWRCVDAYVQLRYTSAGDSAWATGEPQACLCIALDEEAFAFLLGLETDSLLTSLANEELLPADFPTVWSLSAGSLVSDVLTYGDFEWDPDGPKGVSARHSDQLALAAAAKPADEPRQRGQLSAQRRRAAHLMHAQHDPQLTTLAARNAFRVGFTERIRQSHPELSSAEAQRRGEHLYRAHFIEMGRKSAAARARRRARGSGGQ